MTVTLDRSVEEFIGTPRQLFIKMGSGMEPGTQMGPLVSDEQFQRVTSFLESGKADGATALAGTGTAATSSSRPCSPTPIPT